MDFDKAVELREKGYSYKRIGEELGYSVNAVRRRFLQEYDLGNLLHLSGYGASDPRTNTRDPYHLRHGPQLRIGSPIIHGLSQKQKWDVAVRMSQRGHRTLNEYLLELLIKDLEDG